MLVLKSIQEYILNYNNLSNRVSELGLAAKDVQILDKILPQSDSERKEGEAIWNSTLFFSRIFFSYSIILLSFLTISKIGNFSVEKTLLFCGLLSIIMCTGPGVLLTQKNIEKLDLILYHLLRKFKAFTILSIKESLSLSKKSSHKIQYQYVIYPYTLIAFTCIASLTFSEIIFPKDSYLYVFLSKIFMYPLYYFDGNSPWLLYLGIPLILFMSLTLAPTAILEKSFNDHNEYEKLSKRLTIYNFVIALSHILALSIGLIQHLELKFPGESLPIFFSLQFFIIFGPIFFIYIQLGTVIYLHQAITIKYMKKEKATMHYILLIMMLSPYFIFYYIFVQLIPNLIILVMTKVLIFYFELSKFSFKIPSVVRLSGFLIAVFVALFKFLIVT